MKTTHNKNKSILFLHKYGRKAAAYRFRFELFFPGIKSQGATIHTQSLLGDSYLQKLYSSNQRPWLLVLKSYLKRILYLLFPPQHDHKVVYMELFPKLPYFIERLFLKPQSYTLEMDDAFFLSYENGFLKNKIPKLIQNASSVIVGSHYLKNYAERWNSKVCLIPTVVDLKYYEKYKEIRNQSKHIVIGWMGSPSTSKELLLLKSAFQQIERENPVKFLFVGSPKQDLGLQNIEFRDWSEERQIADIYEMDIGIMPLEDDEWNKGKCGFKLIQYMAAGCPVVTSPVGENPFIVSNQIEGLHASTEEEWYEALSILVKSSELRQTMGKQAELKIKNQYSLQSVLKSYLELLLNEL